MAMAAWSSKGGAFEYACGFSRDESIIPVYAFSYVPPGVDLVAEVRTNFYAKSENEKKTWLGSERFGASGSSNRLRDKLSARLRDYWLSPPQIEALLDAARLSTGPTVVDLEICSLVEAEEEAMRPATLRPLDLAPLVNPDRRVDELFQLHPEMVDYDDMENSSAVLASKMDVMRFLYKLYDAGERLVRVDDVEEGTAVMPECGMCRGRPFVGTFVAKLRCGHHFHYHCIVWHVKDHRDCPICARPPYDLCSLPLHEQLLATL
ncbi:hypothetical protein OROHE_022665 [Orobanche hederae]